MSGRAMSSVTRPPPVGLAVERAVVEALHQGDVVVRGTAVRAAGGRSRTSVFSTSASRKTTRSPIGPLDAGGHGPAFAAAAVGVRRSGPRRPWPPGGVVARAVVDHHQLVDQARCPPAADMGRPRRPTTAPTVCSSSRAGMHTETVRPALAPEQPGEWRSAPVEGPRAGGHRRNLPIHHALVTRPAGARGQR